MADVVPSALGLAQTADSPLRFGPRCEGPFGVEVGGVEWCRPDDTTVLLLTAALRRHLLLVLRGQPSPTDAQLDEFFGAFGRLVLHTDDGRMHYASHVRHDGPASEMAAASWQYMTRAADNTGSTYYRPGADGMDELAWHNDQSHRPMLKVVSVLECKDVEPDAVPTTFRDLYTAYETLPRDLRNLLEHRQVAFYDPRLPGPDELPRLADATHPVFTPHPHTGRRALYVNDFADRIVGLDRSESNEVLALLRHHIDRAAPVLEHRWSPGDIVVWDNVGLQHRRDPVPADQRRTLRQYGGLAE